MRAAFLQMVLSYFDCTHRQLVKSNDVTLPTEGHGQVKALRTAFWEFFENRHWVQSRRNRRYFKKLGRRIRPSTVLWVCVSERQKELGFRKDRMSVGCICALTDPAVFEVAQINQVSSSCFFPLCLLETTFEQHASAPAVAQAELSVQWADCTKGTISSSSILLLKGWPHTDVPIAICLLIGQSGCFRHFSCLTWINSTCQVHVWNKEVCSSWLLKKHMYQAFHNQSQLTWNHRRYD